MNLDSIATVISAVGFPIVACIFLGYFIMKQLEASNKQLSEIQKEHNESVSKLAEAVNNNTLVIQKLIDKLS